MKTILTNHLDEIEQGTGLVVEEIVRDRCTSNYCIYGSCNDKFALEPLHTTAIATDVTSFVSPRYQHKVECHCKEGYAGTYKEEKFLRAFVPRAKLMSA